MIMPMNSKTFGNLKDGVRDGMDSAWKVSKRMHFRSPLVFEKPMAARAGGWFGWGFLSVAALALGAWLYFRKRKEVADRYSMGEGPGADWNPERAAVDEMANPA